MGPEEGTMRAVGRWRDCAVVSIPERTDTKATYRLVRLRLRLAGAQHARGGRYQLVAGARWLRVRRRHAKYAAA